jgi:hypothetical protein
MRIYDFNLTLRHESWEFKELTEENIEKQLHQLEEYQKWLKTNNHLFLDSKLYTLIADAVQREIEYHRFYLEFHAARREPGFNQWIFTPKEKVVNRYSWNEPHDQWTRRNGRIKAIIEIDRTGVMTKISVSFENDSETLTFIDSYYGQPKVKPSHAKNPKSIQRKIKEYKEFADRFLKEHLFPHYNIEQRSFSLLKTLLCIDLATQPYPTSPSNSTLRTELLT